VSGIESAHHWSRPENSSLFGVFRRLGGRVAEILQGSVCRTEEAGHQPRSLRDRVYCEIADAFPDCWYRGSSKLSDGSRTDDPTAPAWWAGSHVHEAWLHEMLFGRPRRLASREWLPDGHRQNVPRSYRAGPDWVTVQSDRTCRFGWWTPWYERASTFGQIRVEHRLACRNSLAHWSLLVAAKSALGRYPISGAVRRVFVPWFEALAHRRDGKLVQAEVERIVGGLFSRRVRAWHVHSGRVRAGDWSGFRRHAHDYGAPSGTGRLPPFLRPVEAVYPDGCAEEIVLPGRVYEFDLAALWVMCAVQDHGVEILRGVSSEEAIEASLFALWSHHQGIVAEIPTEHMEFFLDDEHWPAFAGFNSSWVCDDGPYRRNPEWGRRTVRSLHASPSMGPPWQPQRHPEFDLDEALTLSVSVEDSLALARLGWVRPEDLLLIVGGRRERGGRPLLREGGDWGKWWFVDSLALLAETRRRIGAFLPANAVYRIERTQSVAENTVSALLYAAGHPGGPVIWEPIISRLASSPDPAAAARGYINATDVLRGDEPTWT